VCGLSPESLLLPAVSGGLSPGAAALLFSGSIHYVPRLTLPGSKVRRNVMAHTASPAPDNVLIVVDVQEGFVSPSSQHVLEGIENLQYDFDRVIFTKFSNPVSSPFRRILKYCKLAPESEDTRLAIDPREDAVILERSLYTCVTAELRETLKRWRVKDVHIVGIATEACVLKTVLDLFEFDITPWVIADLCASDKNARFHDMAMELIASAIGSDHVLNSHAVAQHA
jgi:nicotinamidase-related amidase